MNKHSPRRSSHAWHALLPIVTLGFYGLRRFEPRVAYILLAVLVLAAWLAAAFFVGAWYDGGERFMIPVVFVMAAVTFFRLLPAPQRRHVSRH
jgi:hypothetical protein